MVSQCFSFIAAITEPPTHLVREQVLVLGHAAPRALGGHPLDAREAEGLIGGPPLRDVKDVALHELVLGQRERAQQLLRAVRVDAVHDVLQRAREPARTHHEHHLVALLGHAQVPEDVHAAVAAHGRPLGARQRAAIPLVLVERVL